MARLTKKPIQIYLDPAQDRALRVLAERRSSSIAFLIRQSVQRYLEEEMPVEEDPALGIVGLGASGLGDLARHHDRYLANWEKEASH